VDDVFLPLAAGCLLALVSALAVVLAARPVHAAVALLAHSLSLAGLFAILGAGFVAVGQIVIYSGAIVVLFLIVVTLLPAPGAADRRRSNTVDRVAAALAAGGALVAALAAALSGASLPATAAAMPGGVETVGRVFFTSPLIVAFELTAPLLLVAIIGAVAIWRRHEPRARQHAPPRPRAAARREVTLHR
jgi:NADH-quinone oxidoreductase subunit J